MFEGFTGLSYFDYDPSLRFERVAKVDLDGIDILDVWRLAGCRALAGKAGGTYGAPVAVLRLSKGRNHLLAGAWFRGRRTRRPQRGLIRNSRRR